MPKIKIIKSDSMPSNHENGYRCEGMG